ncbi:MAG TPA: DUF5681 domain-containing protein [Acetobacteraceae bacterium]|nr:DUF5681 domain-containing protein [Acetobacteraceae bacterium]
MTSSPETTNREHASRGGRWKPGESGNPAGRPKGSRHAALVALDAIGANAAQDILRAVIEQAKAGDMRAAEIMLRRLWPERKGRAVAFDLPPMRTAADLVQGLVAIAEAMAAGELSGEEAASVASVLEIQRKAIETMDLEQRIAALEQRQRGER